MPIAGPRCGAENREKARFCTGCGAPYSCKNAQSISTQKRILLTQGVRKK